MRRRQRFAFSCAVAVAAGATAFIAAPLWAQPATELRRERPQRGPDTVKPGDVAPDFTLQSPDGKRNVTLSAFRGKKPVALVFGSYT